MTSSCVLLVSVAIFASLVLYSWVQQLLHLTRATIVYHTHRVLAVGEEGWTRVGQEGFSINVSPYKADNFESIGVKAPGDTPQDKSHTVSSGIMS